MNPPAVRKGRRCLKLHIPKVHGSYLNRIRCNIKSCPCMHVTEDSGGIAPHILHFGIIFGSVVVFTTWPLYYRRTKRWIR